MDYKITEIIDKLFELKEADAPIEKIAQQTKLLQEMLRSIGVMKPHHLSTKRVSVILPYHSSPVPERNLAPVPQGTKVEVELPTTETTEATEIETPAAETNGTTEMNGTVEVNDTAEVNDTPEEIRKEDIVSARPEKEKVSQQTSLWENTRNKEVNYAFSQPKASLNDLLKQEREELGNKLARSPIPDLSKAIGLNEKYGFINELFRKDENLFNRSIKTIDHCRNMEEASRWIDRELKIKLGWNEEDKMVKHFYDLVRKRFS